jgi:hypothetical protein
MNGTVRSEESADWQWSHIMWQRHGIRLEEWAEMPWHLKMAYIASEQIEDESPVESTNRLARGFLKKKK